MVNTIYLDNSATTKPLKEVMQAFMTVNEQYYANPASIHAKQRQKMCYLLQVVQSQIMQQFLE